MMEIELKLLINPQDAKALCRHPLLKTYAASKPGEQKMCDTYFDTAYQYLCRGDGGLHVKRRAWKLSLPQGNEVECALDIGNIEGGDQKLPVTEIELKLKSGDPTHLFDFALALLQDIPMQIGSLSKAELDYALFASKPPAAVKASPVHLSKRMTVDQAFQTIALNCLAQIQSNAAGVVQGDNAESLHQMRIGLRRLRAALGLFHDILRPHEDFLKELNWLTAQLTSARDWDVLADSTLPTIAEAMPNETRFAEVMLAALSKSNEKHKVAAIAVSSPRYTRLILCFTRWIFDSNWHNTISSQARKRMEVSLKPLSRTMLTDAVCHLLKRGRNLRKPSKKAPHRLRIAAKNARYATEFFQTLIQSKRMQTSVSALSTLQDGLGWFNDLTVADRLLKELQDEQVSLKGSIGDIRRYLSSRAENDKKIIRKLWKRYAATKRS